jgi:hypothetical protein
MESDFPPHDNTPPPFFLFRAFFAFGTAKAEALHRTVRMAGCLLSSSRAGEFLRSMSDSNLQPRRRNLTLSEAEFSCQVQLPAAASELYLRTSYYSGATEFENITSIVETFRRLQVGSGNVSRYKSTGNKSQPPHKQTLQGPLSA